MTTVSSSIGMDFLSSLPHFPRSEGVGTTGAGDWFVGELAAPWGGFEMPACHAPSVRGGEYGAGRCRRVPRAE